MKYFEPMTIDNLELFLSDYKNYDVFDLGYCGDNYFYLKFKKLNNGKEEGKIQLYDKVNNLIQRHSFLTNYFKDNKKMLSFYPVFEIWYYPIGHEKKVKFYINYLNKLDNKIYGEYWDCIEKEYYNQVSLDVFKKDNLAGVRIDISNFNNAEEYFSKIFNYWYFLKTGKTCYEELLEDNYEEDIFREDLLSLEGTEKRDVRILQRLHRQILFSFLAKDINSLRIF